ncbi:response regulator [Paraburkholderia sp. RL17-373-BIF-A]|uniref:response regulator n=1 Tax=Paraburkholderia sp. RL17-373-BIF-A TaxID=3031629 RepID=UPI0038B7319E
MTRILLVDDEPELLEAWSFALEYVGYDVERARDGQEALGHMKRQAPELVITDLMMPGMNGEDLCRTIRQRPQWAHIPIVLHTSAHVGTPVVERLWDSVLRKPARLEVFLATIENLIRG